MNEYQQYAIRTELMIVAIYDTFFNSKAARYTNMSLAKEDNVSAGEHFVYNNDTFSSYNFL